MPRLTRRIVALLLLVVIGVAGAATVLVLNRGENVADLAEAGTAAGTGAEATATTVAALAGPGLGLTATPRQLIRADISIPPSGERLPPGSGSVAQGAVIFAERCVACHGENGAGGQGLVQLTGGIGTLTTERPIKTVSSFWPYATTVFDYIRRAMPINAPMSLTNDEVYAVTAYLLSIDRIVLGAAVLNADTLPAVQMPNRNGFVSWWPPPPAVATN